MTICAECRCAITWVRLLDGTLTTVDSDADPTGNVVLTGSHVEGPAGLLPQARLLDATIPLFDTGTVRYTNHSQKCPSSPAVHPIRTESRLARESLKSTERDRTRIYEYLYEHGPRTDEQLADELELNPNSERPRRGELAADGLVRKAGVGITRSGCKAAVWAAVDEQGRVLA